MPSDNVAMTNSEEQRVVVTGLGTVNAIAAIPLISPRRCGVGHAGSDDFPFRYNGISHS